MNTTLATFMKVGFTVVVIVACVWGILYPHMNTVNDQVNSYISSR